ncbi:hypothetical protein V6N13_113484 [Hibiscus sabdariffa]|uniref:Uncharacterized protein n=1 Tax=Hibiscus sabdariffa TaxID=183260 RepID=A0ABR2CUT2_9ROSI
MAPPTPKLVETKDLKKRPWKQALTLHNRWHPEIPPVTCVKVDEIFRLEMLDFIGGAIEDDDSATDVKLSDLYPVTGSLSDRDGKAAVPGDLLAVEICSFSPFPGVEWGCTTFDSNEWEKTTEEAARTIPVRDNGVNCDIKNLRRGSKICLPVFVGMHFSQSGDEVSFCRAIEMSG